jgi:hypothetical protein
MHKYLSHDTAICRNPPTRDFTGEKKKTWQILNRATIIYVFTEIQGQPISRKHDISTKVCW